MDAPAPSETAPRAGGAAFARSSKAAGATCAGVIVCVLLAYGVPVWDLLRYSAWLVYCVAVPGTLLWRRLRGAPHSFVEDVAGGAAVGYALQILLYIPFRRVGAPMLVLAWPAAVIAAFAFTPSLKPFWRSSGERVPAAWAWSVAACVLVVVAWLAGVFLHTHPLHGPVAAKPYVDYPYHLAVAAEVKHHMPPTWPFVLGERLHHHWFAHAEAAASSWASGVELRVVLLRLQLFPHIVLAVVLTALLATRLARRWWPGPVAVVIAYFVAAFSPYGWSGDGVFNDLRLLHHFQWQAPTQIVAATLFGAVALVMLSRLRREGDAFSQWMLVALLLTASVGSKSTIVPLFLGGCGMLAAVSFLRTRRPHRDALTGIVVGSAVFAFGYFVLYGADSYGLIVEPYARRLAVVRQIGADPAGLGTGTLVLVSALAAGSWLARGAGALGLLARRSRADGSATFLAGIAIASVPLVLMTTHPGGSNVNFLRSAYPMLAALGAAGLAAAAPARKSDGAIVASIAFAAGIGALIATALAMRTPAPPVEATPGEALTAVAKPFLVVAAASVASLVSLSLVGRRLAAVRGAGVMLVLAAVAGTGLANTSHALGKALKPDPADAFTLQKGTRAIASGGLTAARWLRERSSPEDVVATNVHCRFVTPYDQCDNRHFWVAAYTERRVLVEGWGYTSDAMRPGAGFYYAPFRDRQRLADNDAAFAQPSQHTIDRLREYGVRWLFVDGRYDAPSPALSQHATLRFRAGDCFVYSI